MGVEICPKYVTLALTNLKSLVPRDVTIFQGDITAPLTCSILTWFPGSFVQCVNTNFSVGLTMNLLNVLALSDHVLVIILEADIGYLFNSRSMSVATRDTADGFDAILKAFSSRFPFTH